MRFRDNRVVGVYEYSKKMPEFFTNRNGAKNAKTLLSFNSIDRAQLTVTKIKPLAVLSTQYLVLKKAQLTFTKSKPLAVLST